ncbi:hypothetical protein T492DRAFT_1085148 [Pavlovales sp. CCMP2436]|nr:hypothetical protein T492DRAFT_1085148 [Pavlovales sp. CCMP2436]|mmetsp:Transcript_7074/g.17002  ORF Transcript_7074/g.17002 Transcript_7074/m.17002 type:complete len:273 (+) Transcript_7074:48-866(+)
MLCALTTLLSGAREPLARKAVEALAIASGALIDRSIDEVVSEAFTTYIRDDPRRARGAPSRVQGAGQGLFAARNLLAGELVTLYPGIHYPAPPPLGADGTYGHSYLAGTSLSCERDLAYCLTLADGSIIDATPACLAECCILRRRGPRCNALGHLANHPPAGMAPNLLVVDLREFEGAPPIDRGLLAHTPTVPSAYSHIGYGGEAIPFNADDPRRAPRLVGLVAAVSLRDGEELFLDYQRSPTGDAPWFAPVASLDKAAVRAMRVAGVSSQN